MGSSETPQEISVDDRSMDDQIRKITQLVETLTDMARSQKESLAQFVL